MRCRGMWIRRKCVELGLEHEHELGLGLEHELELAGSKSPLFCEA